ncbi:MAG: hypothetical protein INH41_21895, partial [Myxococcaceae bacterium]|nr:hypothetical protein [Myxococcaceae bacterium]
MTRRLATLSITVGLLVSCGRTSLPCLPETCSGCCDALDTCRTGTAPLECGAGAARCQACAAGATCQAGRCQGAMGGGAGGGAATGGGATAGGGVAGGGAGVGGGGGEVVIAAKRLAPDVMLVVDRSGSMTLPLDPADAACSACNGTTCPPGCVTRGRHMQQQVTAFATNLADVARLGLV